MFNVRFKCPSHSNVESVPWLRPKCSWLKPPACTYCFLYNKRVESAHKWKLASPERIEWKSRIFVDLVLCWPLCLRDIVAAHPPYMDFYQIKPGAHSVPTPHSGYCFWGNRIFWIRNLQVEVFGTSQMFQSYHFWRLESWFRIILSTSKILGHSKFPKSFWVTTKIYTKGNQISSSFRLRIGKHRRSTRLKRRDFRERHYINLIWKRN